jgi:hypothetical protein
VRPLLVIMNPRRIPECMAALEDLPVPKVWVTGYPQSAIPPILSGIVEGSDFTHYINTSDDVVPSRRALAAVLRLASRHPVATGYCNLDMESPLVNLTRSPLLDYPPTEGSYDFIRREDVKRYPRVTVPSFFAGMSLTCMTRELWLRFPLSGFTASCWGTDYSLSYRLGRARIPIVAHRAAFVWHVKERWNRTDQAPEKRLLVGKIPPEVRWDT